LLKDGLYSGENLDQDLDSATLSYLKSEEGEVLDRSKLVLYLSMIFKWYKEDFEVGGETEIYFIARYMANDDGQFFIENRKRTEIEYREYNWSLNIIEEEEKDASLEINDSSP